MTVTTLPPPAPPLTEHDGRAITWSPWRGGLVFVCPGGAIACECGATDTTLTAVGTAATLPGETYAVPAESRAQRRAAGTLDPAATVEVPAWPVKRLHATLCTSCGDLAIYDLGQLGGRFDLVEPTTQLGLFE